MVPFQTWLKPERKYRNKKNQNVCENAAMLYTQFLSTVLQRKYIEYVLLSEKI